MKVRVSLENAEHLLLPGMYSYSPCSAAMVLGVLPLILASGAGAVSRFNMGLVIASGLTIGTLFTLFVVPAVYMVLGADHHKNKPASEGLIH